MKYHIYKANSKFVKNPIANRRITHCGLNSINNPKLAIAYEWDKQFYYDNIDYDPIELGMGDICVNCLKSIFPHIAKSVMAKQINTMDKERRKRLKAIKEYKQLKTTKKRKQFKTMKQSKKKNPIKLGLYNNNGNIRKIKKLNKFANDSINKQWKKIIDNVVPPPEPEIKDNIIQLRQCDIVFDPKKPKDSNYRIISAGSGNNWKVVFNTAMCIENEKPIPLTIVCSEVMKYKNCYRKFNELIRDTL